MKKLLKISLPITIGVIIILIGLTMFKVHNKKININKFINKYESIIENINDNENGSININESYDGVIISISDSIHKAKTFNSYSDRKDFDIDKVKEEVIDFIDKNNYNPEWVKIDLLNEDKTYMQVTFSNELSNYETNYYDKPLLLKFLSGKKVLLTPDELNINEILNYKSHNNIINIDNLNKYLKDNDKEKELITNSKDELSDIVSYNKVSYFIDEDNVITKLDNDFTYDLETLLSDGVTYLYNLIKDDGSFDYRYDPYKDKNVDEYNILRHSGSIWAIVKNQKYIKDTEENKIKNIAKSIDYVLKRTVPRDNGAYILNETDDSLRLGANGLLILAMCEFQNNFNDDSYLYTAKKLAQGIINSQHENGAYTHVYDFDLNVLKEYNSEYYDGEVIYGLLELYKITKEEKYLDSAIKGTNYYIDEFEKTNYNHWFGYVFNDIQELCSNNKKYNEEAINIYNRFIDDLMDRNYTSHTAFEFMVQINLLYNDILNNNYTCNNLNQVNKTSLRNNLYERYNIQLKSYVFKWNAMYYKKPQKVLNSIIILKDHRIRVDDIQHSLLGFSEYLNNYEALHK